MKNGEGVRKRNKSLRKLGYCGMIVGGLVL